jgi:GT2 family glycosyltransferase
VRVAVLTLVRDRLDYTQHSTDGVSAWLEGEYRPHFLTRVPANIGISRGMNVLLASRDQDYDVVVKFDNDCELVQEFTLERVCDAVYETGALLSPVIRGLNHPPQPIREREMGSETILEIHQIGGIFLAAPRELYDGFSYSDSNPLWGGDDLEVCAHWRRQGYWCGYVKDLEAWHYEGTSQQYLRYPEYYQRRVAEGGPR